jgi:hypothetical protein
LYKKKEKSRKINMDQIISQRQSVRDFWGEHHSVYMLEAKVDKIYEAYVQWMAQTHRPDLRRTRNEQGKLTDEKLISKGFLDPINRYQFRTLIRKMGYLNGRPKSVKTPIQSEVMTQ